MSLSLKRAEGGVVHFRFLCDPNKLRPFIIIVCIGFAMGAMMMGRAGGGGALAFLAVIAIPFVAGLIWLKRKLAIPFELTLDPVQRSLQHREGDYTFPHVGYLTLDSFLHASTARAGDSQGGTRQMITRLSFVPREAGDEELSERCAEIEGRPPSFSKGSPPAPGGGDVLLPNMPYALGRAFAREAGIALNLPLMDLTSRPPRLLAADEQSTGLGALREAAGLRSELGPPPRGVRRKTGPDSVVLTHSPSALWMRILMLVGSTGMALMLYVCSGLKLYIGVWPLLLGLVVWGRSRWTITSEGITTGGTWFGIKTGETFFSYDEIDDISAARGKEYPCVRVTAGGETTRIIVPRMEMAQYVAAAALSPPEGAHAEAGPYR